MVDLTVACDKLLGFETVEDVAGYFKHEGVQGLRGGSDSCVVAQWLQAQTGEDYNVSCLGVWNNAVQAEDIVEFPRDSALSEFIRQFDRGAFPALTSGADPSCLP